MRSHPPTVWARVASGALLLASAGPAYAAVEPAAATAPEGGVRIESSTCPHPLVEDVQHLARVELNSAGLPDGEDAPRVTLTCSGRVVLIRAALGPEGDVRQLDLDQTEDNLRPRVIALAIAELVRDTANRAVRPPLLPAPPINEAKTEIEPALAPPPVLHSESKNRLVLFGKLSNFGSNFQPLFGGGLGFAHDLGHFSLGLGSELVASNRDTALGSVHVLAADLSVRLALRFPSRILPAEIGIGHALGLAQLSGTNGSPNADASSLSGVWAAPFLFGGIEAPLGDAFFLQLAAQIGVVTWPVRGYVDHSSDVGMTGFWGALTLGVGLNL